MRHEYTRLGSHEVTNAQSHYSRWAPSTPAPPQDRRTCRGIGLKPDASTKKASVASFNLDNTYAKTGPIELACCYFGMS